VTWLKVDDKLTTHPKWVGLTLEAKSLWFHAAVWCAAHNNDGELPTEAMPLIVFSASVPAAAMDSTADRLVKAKLWRRLSKGRGFEILNWLDYQPSKQQVKEKSDADDVAAEMRRLHAWLHKKVPGKRVKRLIDARDGLWCRYCRSETVITPGDRRGPHRRTYDLIDPTARWDMVSSALPEATLRQIADKWAVACGWCNAVKGPRTPDEAGMVLLAPPDLSRHDVLPRSAANRSGTVRVVGPGLAVPDLAGPVLAGTGAGLQVDVVSGSGAPPPHTDEDFRGESA
jgi:hypothetical protein